MVLLWIQEVDNVKRLQEEMRRTILDANNQIASVITLDCTATAEMIAL